MKDDDELSSSPPQPPTPPSSPPRPSSPQLPVSTGPDNEKYSLSPSSVSPTTSPAGSPHASTEKLYLQQGYISSTYKNTHPPSSFSVDRGQEPRDDSYSQSSSCLQELLEWFVLRCCNCFSWNFHPISKSHLS